MSASPSVVITTRLPPQICGIGAYSWLAYKHRPNDSSPTAFFVMEGATESRALLGWDDITDFNGNPRKLAEALDRAGIASRPGITNAHEPPLSPGGGAALPESERASRQSLMLPIFPGMTKDDVGRVVAALVAAIAER